MSGEFANAYVGPPYNVATVEFDNGQAANDDTIQAARSVGAGNFLLGELVKGQLEGSEVRVNSAWFGVIVGQLQALRYLHSAGIRHILLHVEDREECINVEEKMNDIHIE